VPRCRSVLARVALSPGVTRTLVGRMSAILPLRKYYARTRTTGNRHMQARSGAPGLDRTADTRFRKHAAGVVSRSQPCANVLHSPRFGARSVIRPARPCCTVVGRLVDKMSARCRQDVGKMSAMTSPSGSVAAADIHRPLPSPPAIRPRLRLRVSRRGAGGRAAPPPRPPQLRASSHSPYLR
jgi:hypothetical protein